MKIPGLKNRKIIGSMMLVFLLVQLFSAHFHFGHMEATHGTHVHSFLFSDHDLDPETISSDHGEEENRDLLAWLSKKLSSFDLPVVISFILILPIFILLQHPSVTFYLPRWQYLQFFIPPLRAPPQ